ncbi:MAG: hypothetical protein JOZ15_13555 [Acidobacteria bacterium]|nr:hypothetical protein [Acidobacteriota bacterium]
MDGGAADAGVAETGATDAGEAVLDGAEPAVSGNPGAPEVGEAGADDATTRDVAPAESPLPEGRAGRTAATRPSRAAPVAAAGSACREARVIR